MRKHIYNGITEAAKATGIIRHVDLWNRNVEFIEQEVAWERPAVFVEFGPVSWKPFKGGYRGGGTVRLHVVTDWKGQQETGDADVFTVQDTVVRAVEGIRGPMFSSLCLIETLTNHDHEEIVESVAVLSYRCSDGLGTSVD